MISPAKSTRGSWQRVAAKHKGSKGEESAAGGEEPGDRRAPYNRANQHQTHKPPRDPGARRAIAHHRQHHRVQGPLHLPAHQKARPEQHQQKRQQRSSKGRKTGNPTRKKPLVVGNAAQAPPTQAHSPPPEKYPHGPAPSPGSSLTRAHPPRQACSACIGPIRSES